ncbi:Choline oxidase [Orchesella cincta]|uniref:Choline oxidase n=1 Tax=Orchesella cincta TaxID=48709 RepID=A0A1D2M295_ORCCI|nr:Choline oxidase [Orchesella cincta]
MNCNLVADDILSKRVAFSIRGISGDARFYKVNGARTVKSLNVGKQSLDFDSLKDQYEYLEGLPVSSYVDGRPRILLGQQEKLLSLARKYSGHSVLPKMMNLVMAEDSIFDENHEVQEIELSIKNRDTCVPAASMQEKHEECLKDLGPSLPMQAARCCVDSFWTRWFRKCSPFNDGESWVLESWKSDLQFWLEWTLGRIEKPSSNIGGECCGIYYSDPRGQDMNVMLEGIQTVSKIKELLECVTRTLTGTLYHPSSTCSMGKPGDPGTVVDSQLRVAGTRGLRVADSSIMPKLVNKMEGFRLPPRLIAKLLVPTAILMLLASHYGMSQWLSHGHSLYTTAYSKNCRQTHKLVDIVSEAELGRIPEAQTPEILKFCFKLRKKRHFLFKGCSGSSTGYMDYD